MAEIRGQIGSIAQAWGLLWMLESVQNPSNHSSDGCPVKTHFHLLVIQLAHQPHLSFLEKNFLPSCETLWVEFLTLLRPWTEGVMDIPLRPSPLHQSLTFALALEPETVQEMSADEDSPPSEASDQDDMYAAQGDYGYSY